MQFAEAHGWRYVHSSSHPWGKLYCPGGRPGDSKMSVNEVDPDRETVGAVFYGVARPMRHSITPAPKAPGDLLET